jgi:hypothetical protein
MQTIILYSLILIGGPYLETVWERDANRVPKKFKFFLLKFNMICIFWIILMC